MRQGDAGRDNPLRHLAVHDQQAQLQIYDSQLVLRNHVSSDRPDETCAAVEVRLWNSKAAGCPLACCNVPL